MGKGIQPEHLNDDRLGRILDKLYAFGLTEIFVTIALAAARCLGDGNEADSAMFAQLVTEFRQQWQIDALFVADAALYNGENLAQMSQLRWVSRVPATLKDAQELLINLDPDALVTSMVEGYKIAVIGNQYSGINQRWLLVESQARLESDLAQLAKQIAQKLALATKALKQLEGEQFACQPDALQAATKFSAALALHQLTDLEIVEVVQHKGGGRPKRDAVGQKHYQIRATVAPNQSAIATVQQRAGRFILATNVLDEQEFSNDGILREYKAQQSTERGFRFLKDPLFFTSSVFLNTPERVAALAMVMGLCLLVYSLAQRSLRSAFRFDTSSTDC